MKRTEEAYSTARCPGLHSTLGILVTEAQAHEDVWGNEVIVTLEVVLVHNLLNWVQGYSEVNRMK